MELLGRIQNNRAFRLGFYSVSAAIIAGGLYIANEQGKAMQQGSTVEELLDNYGTPALQPEIAALNQTVTIEE
jgi:hypothetical protein